MANVLLLTRHFNDNCGTVYQAYATCEILKQCGHNVTVLNLTDRNYGKELCQIKGFLQIPSKIKFALFRKRFLSNLTHSFSKLSDYHIPEADYIIVGSDQVWNKAVTKSLFYDYFLVSVPDTYMRISLSSSFATDYWEANENDTAIVSKALNKFKAISVREETGVTICNETFGIEAAHLVDPTLALGDFSPFINKKIKEKNEVLFYSFKSEGYAKGIVDYICKQTGAKARRVGVVNRKDRHKYLSTHPFFMGPKDWLNYIAHSRCVVTDSFHGIVFSLLNHRQFVAVMAHKERFSRIESLLTLLGLENRIALSYEEFVEDYDAYMSPIDYSEVDKKLSEQRRLFFAFVKRNVI